MTGGESDTGDTATVVATFVTATLCVATKQNENDLLTWSGTPA